MAKILAKLWHKQFFSLPITTVENEVVVVVVLVNYVSIHWK